jgi:hypothetical protein
MADNACPEQCSDKLVRTFGVRIIQFNLADSVNASFGPPGFTYLQIMQANTPQRDETFLVAKIDEYLADYRKELLNNSTVETDTQGLRHAYLRKADGKLVATTSDVLEITAPMPGRTVTEIVTDGDLKIVSVSAKPLDREA